MPVIRTNSELEERLYGPRGIPSEGRFFDPVAIETQPELPIVDALGRVNGKTYPELNDDIPEFLRSSAVKAKQAVVNKQRRVTLIKDHTLDYPTLCMSVFVMPDPDVQNDEARFAKMFARAGCKRAATVEDADLVVFGGGSDVDPALYGAKRHSKTFFDSNRDSKDLDLYVRCLEQGIPMFGVCRGAQFLHVCNGGKLFQDVDGHYGDHPVWDVIGMKLIEKTSSVHHQMCMLNVEGGMTLIGTAARSHERAVDDNHVKIGNNADVEAFYYGDTGSLGVQGHPEYEGYNYFTCWCLELIRDFIFMNPDFYWTPADHAKGIIPKLRMKPELLEQRKALANLPSPTIEIHTKETK